MGLNARKSDNKGTDHQISAFCYSLSRMDKSPTNSMKISMILTSLCSWAGWFGPYIVKNLEDRFSHVKAKYEANSPTFQVTLSRQGLSCHLKVTKTPNMI